MIWNCVSGFVLIAYVHIVILAKKFSFSFPFALCRTSCIYACKYVSCYSPHCDIRSIKTCNVDGQMRS